MATHTNTHAILGMIRAQELLTISLIRTLPSDLRGKVIDEFAAQVARAELAHVKAESEQETLDAFRTHIKQLSLLLTSLQ